MAEIRDRLPVLVVDDVREFLRLIREKQCELFERDVMSVLQGLVGWVLSECLNDPPSDAILKKIFKFNLLPNMYAINYKTIYHSLSRRFVYATFDLI